MAANERSNVHDLMATSARPTTAPQIVDYLLTQAIRLHASDLHLGMQLQAGALVATTILRYRVHGKLQTLRSEFIGPLYKEVISRLKVLAGINTTEVFGPQDGQLVLSTPDGPVVMRLAFIPTPDGEEVVARVQRGQKNPTLEQLGMTKEMLARVGMLIQQKSGLIILNGPAGSGKTTTIYALLSSLAGPERKIITAEDPVELKLPYVTHTSVTKQISFATLARAFMRADADVIFIGEVRDAESAEAAVQLAQTGHLVLTTLHTRDALGVVPRLEAFGIHPNFISAALIGSLAQRLSPRLCPACRVEGTPDEKTLKRMASVLPPPAGTRFFRAGPGCPQCVTGVNGRVPFYELLIVDAKTSEMINQRATLQDLLHFAQYKGMFTLAQEALMRVYTGYIDYESVRSYITGPDFTDAEQTSR